VRDGTHPALSVILVSATEYDPVRAAVRNLKRQQADIPIEVVLVGPAAVDTALLESDRADLESFAAWQHVDVARGTPYDDARAAGVRAARAPLIAFSEDHSFPQPGWAAALVRAFDHGWTGVGPAIENANPHSVVSWANLLIEYGPWVSPASAGACAHIPGHNSAYRRDALLALSDRLATMIRAETVMQWLLGRSGHRFTIEPAARTRHLNFEFFVPSLALRFHTGRQFACQRSATWSRFRRAVFAAATPLITLVRLMRIVSLPVMTRRPAMAMRALPLLVLFLSVASVGELVGYATARAGGSTAYLTEIEFGRWRFTAKADLAMLG